MSPSPRLFTLVLKAGLCLALATVPAAADHGQSKLDKILRDARRDASVQRVIIQARPGRVQALRASLQRRGAVVEQEHDSLDALTVDLRGRDLAALEADPAVLAVSVDAEVSSFGGKVAIGRGGRRRPAPPAPVQAPDSSPAAAVLAYAGSGINVAVVDSGIAPLDDLADNIAGFWDFTRGGVAARPSDAYGHGTHVAGLIAGSGALSNREFVGVAPGVKLYGFKVLDSQGRGRASHVVRALEFITANKRSAAPGAIKIDIINLSLGHPIYEPAASDPLVRAVENAVRAGIVVLTAAGNLGAARNGEEGYTGITSPGNAPSAITIGAVDTNGTARLDDDRVAPFSSRGPTWFDGLTKPDLVAPGVNLIAVTPRLGSLYRTYPQLRVAPRNGKGSFGRLSGTSMAAAVATGVSAVVLQASRAANPEAPALSPNALKAVLQYTAFPMEDGSGKPYDALTQGTGSINPFGAIEMALAINTSMPARSPWLRMALEPATRVAGTLEPWARSVTWHQDLIQRTDALSFNSPIWGDNIVWGTAASDSDNIVWGTAAEIDNIVWGTASTWASNLVWKDRIIGMMRDIDNIVWGTALGLDAENIVWGTVSNDNIVWGTWDGDNIVWGTSGIDNIVWGTLWPGGGGLVPAALNRGER